MLAAWLAARWALAAAVEPRSAATGLLPHTLDILRTLRVLR
jgi:hypothetical protein